MKIGSPCSSLHQGQLLDNGTPSGCLNAFQLTTSLHARHLSWTEWYNSQRGDDTRKISNKYPKEPPVARRRRRIPPPAARQSTYGLVRAFLLSSDECWLVYVNSRRTFAVCCLTTKSVEPRRLPRMSLLHHSTRGLIAAHVRTDTARPPGSQPRVKPIRARFASSPSDHTPSPSLTLQKFPFVLENFALFSSASPLSMYPTPFADAVRGPSHQTPDQLSILPFRPCYRNRRLVPSARVSSPAPASVTVRLIASRYR